MTGEQAYASAREIWQSQGAVAVEPWPLWSQLDADEQRRWDDIGADASEKDDDD